MSVTDGGASDCCLKVANTHQEEEQGHTNDPQVRQHSDRFRANGRGGWRVPIHLACQRQLEVIVKIIRPLALNCYLSLPPAFHPKYHAVLTEATRRLPAEVDTNGGRLRPRDLQL